MSHFASTSPIDAEDPKCGQSLSRRSFLTGVAVGAVGTGAAQALIRPNVTSVDAGGSGIPPTAVAAMSGAPPRSPTDPREVFRRQSHDAFRREASEIRERRRQQTVET